MRVTTEKRLSQWKRIAIQKGLDGIKSMELLGHIIKECQEIDQLTVTKLRPMSEAPRDGAEFMLYHKGLMSTFVDIAKYKEIEKIHKFVPSANIFTHIREVDMIGWLPLPIYKPEQS